jgi:hypothetical protein
MIKVKITLPGAAKNINLSQFLGNQSNLYKDCKFFVNEFVADPDFWFLFEGPAEEDFECFIDPSFIYFVTAEVALPSGYYSENKRKDFLNQFSKIFTCHDVYESNVTNCLPFLPWMINANHGNTIFEQHERDFNYFSNLSELNKTKNISVFCSSVTWTDNHKQRLRFVKKLKEHFKDKLDWFGNGVNGLERKWDGIASYKYHLTLENQSTFNVITEKLYDAFLGLCYPIYWGAPNVNDYFEEGALTSININDLNGSIQTIEKIINEDYYEKHFDNILRAKNLCLNKYNVFHRISEICANDYNYASNPSVRSVKINKIDFEKSISYANKILNFSGKVLRKIGNELIIYSTNK